MCSKKNINYNIHKLSITNTEFIFTIPDFFRSRFLVLQHFIKKLQR